MTGKAFCDADVMTAGSISINAAVTAMSSLIAPTPLS